MNSEGKIGVIVEWLKPIAERDYDNLVEGVDFIIINPSRICPRADGLPVQFDNPKMEWLLRADGESISPDYNIYYETIVSRPTNTKDTELTNYNLFLNERVLVRRTNEEIVAVIRDKENEANNSVLGEAERNKLAMLAPAINVKLSSGIPLNTQETAVRNRMIEVAEKAMLNASNAASLISLVEAGNTPDVTQGWEYDNITNVGYPFA